MLNLNNIPSVVIYFASLIISVLILLFTIIPIAYARYGSKFKYRYLEQPRTLIKYYKPWGKRAQWAHENSFEAFIIYSPAIILAIILEIQGISLPIIVNQAAILYPAFRILYVILFLINKPILRSFFWGGGLCCSLLIYFLCFNNVLKILINSSL
tara:strand:- start:1059 stop:1523 length:465 start_codon:yes stop_codon:yes gene_type:complete